MAHPPLRLILVYNAESGWLNAVKDAVWKVVRPATYPCSLCALTYGWVSMHRRWRQFLERVPMTKVFHHKDDFAAAFPGLAVALPAILLAEDGAPPRVLVSAAEMGALPDLAALIVLVEARLRAWEARSGRRRPCPPQRLRRSALHRGRGGGSG